MTSVLLSYCPTVLLSYCPTVLLSYCLATAPIEVLCKPSLLLLNYPSTKG